MGVQTPSLDAPSAAALSDADVVRRVRAGEHGLYEILMRRHNQLIYRAVRAVLRDEDEVEDAMQQAYISAFKHLHQFEERAKFSTWLTRIALNEAFHRRRSRQRDQKDGDAEMDTFTSPAPDPERQAYTLEL